MTLCACDALQLFASCVALAMDAEQCAAVPLTACRSGSRVAEADATRVDS